jgi:hypothetical protein
VAGLLLTLVGTEPASATVRGYSDFTCAKFPMARFEMEVLTPDSIRAISLRVRGVKARGLSAVGTQRSVGRLTVAAGASRRSETLRTPARSRTGPLPLLSKDGLRVVYRPGHATFLSVYGLPEQTLSVSISLRAGLLRKTARKLYATRTVYLVGKRSESSTADSNCGR